MTATETLSHKTLTTATRAQPKIFLINLITGVISPTDELYLVNSKCRWMLQKDIGNTYHAHTDSTFPSPQRHRWVAQLRLQLRYPSLPSPEPELEPERHRLVAQPERAAQKELEPERHRLVAQPERAAQKELEPERHRLVAQPERRSFRP